MNWMVSHFSQTLKSEIEVSFTLILAFKKKYLSHGILDIIGCLVIKS